MEHDCSLYLFTESLVNDLPVECEEEDELDALLRNIPGQPSTAAAAEAEKD